MTSVKRRVRIHHAPGGCTLDGLIGSEDAIANLKGNKTALTYQCKACKKRCCWCNGAADNHPNHCDRCWAKAEKRKK